MAFAIRAHLPHQAILWRRLHESSQSVGLNDIAFVVPAWGRSQSAILMTGRMAVIGEPHELENSSKWLKLDREAFGSLAAVWRGKLEAFGRAGRSAHENWMALMHWREHFMRPSTEATCLSVIAAWMGDVELASGLERLVPGLERVESGAYVDSLVEEFAYCCYANVLESVSRPEVNTALLVDVLNEFVEKRGETRFTARVQELLGSYEAQGLAMQSRVERRVGRLLDGLAVQFAGLPVIEGTEVDAAVLRSSGGVAEEVGGWSERDAWVLVEGIGDRRHSRVVQWGPNSVIEGADVLRVGDLCLVLARHVLGRDRNWPIGDLPIALSGEQAQAAQVSARSFLRERHLGGPK